MASDDTHETESENEDFGDLDFESLERESAAVEKKQQFTDYRRTTDGVVAREQFARGSVPGESELESKVLKIIIVIIAVSIPCLTLYWQFSSSGDDRAENAATEQADPAE